MGGPLGQTRKSAYIPIRWACKYCVSVGKNDLPTHSLWDCCVPRCGNGQFASVCGEARVRARGLHRALLQSKTVRVHTQLWRMVTTVPKKRCKVNLVGWRVQSHKDTEIERWQGRRRHFSNTRYARTSPQHLHAAHQRPQSLRRVVWGQLRAI